MELIFPVVIRNWVFRCCNRKLVTELRFFDHRRCFFCLAAELVVRSGRSGGSYQIVESLVLKLFRRPEKVLCLYELEWELGSLSTFFVGARDAAAMTRELGLPRQVGKGRRKEG